MRLLVSVRCGAEVAAAVEGGADIIDAKEPSRGSLGVVDPPVLAEIAASLPSGVPLSVALGDYRQGVRLQSPALSMHGARYLKIGFAGIASEPVIRRALTAVVTAAGLGDGGAGIVAVGYADDRRASTLDPRSVTRLAIQTGAAGVLLDTSVKDDRDLLSWMCATELKDWVDEVRTAGLLAAVAGSLRVHSMPAVAAAGPDVIGIRGAACEGGRSGQVSADRVRAVRSVLPAQ